MNILLINHYAGSPMHGMEYRPYYFAREWVSSGHRVMIVGASYSHLRSKQPDVRHVYEEEAIDGIRYVWLKTSPYKGNGLGRIKNMLSFLVHLYRYMNRLTEKFIPDVVIASSTYPLDIYPAKRLAKKYKAKLVFEVHDLWPLSPMELGNMSQYHPFIMVMQVAENYAYRHADKVVSLLPKAKEHMMAHGMAEEKFVHIPNGICVQDWKLSDRYKVPIEEEKVLESLKTQGCFLVGYTGAHGIANALYCLLNVAQIIQDTKIRFILIGEGQEKGNLIKKAKNKKLLNIIFLPAVRKNIIPRLLKNMDVLYIGLQSQSLFRFGISPNKMMDYMMAEKPILNAIEAGNDPVAEAQCGISVPAEDVDAIANAILRMKNYSPEERASIGKRGEEFVLKHHDYRVLAKKFIDTLKFEN